MPLVDQTNATAFMKVLVPAWRKRLVKLSGDERNFVEGAWRHYDHFSSQQIQMIITLMMRHANALRFNFGDVPAVTPISEVQEDAGGIQRKGVVV